MKNLLSALQLKAADTYTIKHLPISSIDLMELASIAFLKVFTRKFKDKKSKIAIFCGQGNNGGDGLAIARLLCEKDYRYVSVYLVNFFQRSVLITLRI